MATPFVMERVYNAPPEVIWKALTDKDEMKKWYFDLSAFRAEPGFEFSFIGGPADRQYVHLCRVTTVEKHKKLAYTWKYEGYEGESEVTFELFGEGGQTGLRLTHSGLETFTATNADFARSNFERGWTGILGTSLAKYVSDFSHTS